MEKTLSKIAILSDDFSAEEFDAILKARLPESDVSIQTTILKKEGRSENTLIELVFSVGMTASLLSSLIYDLCKFGFSKLLMVSGSKPKVVITLANDIRIELPVTLDDSEIKSRIQEAVQNNAIKSIEFDS
jgi:hypothetical protein